MDKFGRRYLLQIGIDAFGSAITLQLPFTLEFDIIRNTLTSANVCQLRIYNLSEKNRNRIRFNVSNYGEYRSIVLKAGYGINLPTIFQGNVSQAWSFRESGSTNFITQIECYDGGFAFANADISIPFPQNTPYKDVISTLAGSLPHVSKGAIGDYPGELSRGNSYAGNPTNILSGDLTGGGFFIDREKANALGTNEYIADLGGITKVNAKSGLLGTPMLEQTIVHFDMIFEPNLQVGQKVSLESLTEKNFNGDYKVTAVKHRGMISESVCGEAITTGEFFYTKLLSPVAQAG